MKKLVLMSILFATIWIPAVAAKDPNARRGMHRTLLYSVAFYVAYWLALMFVVSRLQ
jgi:hypothetical protein